METTYVPKLLAGEILSSRATVPELVSPLVISNPPTTISLSRVRIEAQGGEGASSRIEFAPFGNREAGPSASIQAVDRAFSSDVVFSCAGNTAVAPLTKKMVLNQTGLSISTGAADARFPTQPLDVTGRVSVRGIRSGAETEPFLITTSFAIPSFSDGTNIFKMNDLMTSNNLVLGQFRSLQYHTRHIDGAPTQAINKGEFDSGTALRWKIQKEDNSADINLYLRKEPGAVNTTLEIMIHWAVSPS